MTQTPDIRFVGLAWVQEGINDPPKLLAEIATTNPGYFSVSGRMDSVRNLGSGEEYRLFFDHGMLEDKLSDLSALDPTFAKAMSEAFKVLCDKISAFEALDLDKQIVALKAIKQVPNTNIQIKSFRTDAHCPKM